MKDSVEAQSEGEVPITHQGLSESATEYVAASEFNLERLVEVQRLQEEHPQLHLTICQRVQQPTYRAVLVTIRRNTTATYDGIEANATVSRRSIRDAVNTLQEENIVTKENSRLVTVKFANRDVEVLAADAIAKFFNGF